MKAGDLVFFKSTSLIGRIITKLTKSEFSHVAMATDETHIIESNYYIKTREIELTPDRASHIAIYRVNELTPEQAERVVQFARMLIGTPYDFVGILVWFIRLLFKWNIPNLVNDLNRMWCSELVDVAYSSVGIDLVPEQPYGDVTPEDLVKSSKVSLVELK